MTLREVISDRDRVSSLCFFAGRRSRCREDQSERYHQQDKDQSLTTLHLEFLVSWHNGAIVLSLPPETLLARLIGGGGK